MGSFKTLLYFETAVGQKVKNEMKMEGTKREDYYALATKGEAHLAVGAEDMSYSQDYG